jgi:photosystem II stability/assembly factor-like uncharacterized protein
MTVSNQRNDVSGDRNDLRLWVSPESYLFPYKIQLFGVNWSFCPVAFLLDGEKPLYPMRILIGEGQGEKVKPVSGEFQILFNEPKLKPGEHFIVAVSESRERTLKASAKFFLEDISEPEKDGRPRHRWFRRQEHFLRQRFPDGVNRLPGNRIRAFEHREYIKRVGLARGVNLKPFVHRRDPDFPSPPVDPGCNWYCIGPSVVRKGQVFSTASNTYTTAPISGRITSIAYDPNDTNVVYAAAAQGGVWKSTDEGLNWRPKSDFEVSLAIGCVVVDPSVTDGSGRSTRILAGTGEPNQSDSYYGGGILISFDGGETWSARGTAVFARDAFSTIVVDPNDNQHLYAATDIGVYESTDEGVNWNQIEPGMCYDLVVDWNHPGGPELYVGRTGVGVRRSQDGGVTWTTLGGGLPASLGRIALALSSNDSNVLYAAFANGGDGLTGIYRTTDGGTTWTQTTSSPTGVAQSPYNLVIAINPADNDIVLFGEVHLWRTTDGGTNWTRVSTGSPGIHADQHAIAFHPTNNNTVLIGNDGGVFYSTDGGVTFIHRNKDLATLQYFGISNHPNYDAVILGGTQDNGAQRYCSHPAWEHSALGDGAFAAINSTSDIRRWYETRWWDWPCFRNDQAGEAGSWVSKKAGISTNSNWFYPPLMMDPNDSSILYVGYDELWRTDDHADSWTAITGTLVNTNTNITAIAIAPSDSNVLYVGLDNGRVYKITYSGGTWTSTNVTGAPLPAGQISDIAIHPTDSNTVYVTTSNLIFSEATGEFTNDHVFRTTDGGNNWTSISTGLSQDNPVNTIVMDPDNPTTIFIGADVGIYRSDDGGTTWYVWDDGLPNCSVQDLTFFPSKRLLRAATHGRSVWERSVDAASCPLTDVYIRDNCLDTPINIPSPTYVNHPFIAGETVYWFQSADLKIDCPDPTTNTYQTPSTDINYIEFEEMDHNNPRRETWVRVYAQVHNRGNNPATNVKVRAFWAYAGAGLPDLPTDFWTAFPNSDPSDMSVWHAVGLTRTITELYPNQPKICSWNWLVPADAPTSSCMLGVVQSDEDVISTTSLHVSSVVKSENNVTLKNLHIDDVIPGATGAGGSIIVGPYYIDFAYYAKRLPFDIRFNPGVLPLGTNIHVFFPEFETERNMEDSTLGMKILKTDDFIIPHRLEEMCGKPTEYNSQLDFLLRFDEKIEKGLPGVYSIVPNGEKFSAAFFMEFPNDKLIPGSRLTFHIEHWIRNDIVGGSSYEFRVRKDERKQTK